MEARALGSAGRSLTARTRLGRGLSALLGGDDPAEELPEVIPMDSVTEVSDGTGRQIRLELIERNPGQPRRDFDQAAIDELADSIRRHGVLQPLLVRPAEGDSDAYQLIAGERRWRAAQQAGLEFVPCHVISFSDQQASEAALEENLKREDLNILEKALAFREYLERFGGTIEDLARQLSMSRASVSNTIRLLELPDAIQELLRNDSISAGHARALLPLSIERQVMLAKQVAEQQLSVRRTEDAVRNLLRAAEESPVRSEAGEESAASIGVTSHVLSLQNMLRDALQARVEIRVRGGDSGQIVIHFGNNKDFERIVGRLRKAS